MTHVQKQLHVTDLHIRPQLLQGRRSKIEEPEMACNILCIISPTIIYSMCTENISGANCRFSESSVPHYRPLTDQYLHRLIL